MDFVYPYITSEAIGNELELSIASVRRFYRGDAKIFVIGDEPSSTIVCNHIPIARKKVSVDGDSRHVGFTDVLSKIKTAIEHPGIAEEFTWMMDDIWLTKPITLEQLRTPIHQKQFSRQTLDDWNPGANYDWLRIKKQTLLELDRRGETLYDYATHAPHVVEKSKLVQLFSQWNMPPVMLWEVIYGNLFKSNPQLYSPFFYRWKGRQDRSRLRKRIADASIVNCNHSGFDATSESLLSEIIGIDLVRPLSHAQPPVRRRTVQPVKNELPVNRRTRREQRKRMERLKQNRSEPKLVPQSATELAILKDNEQPCPGKHRGKYLETKDNRLCSKRSKRSVPVYQCELLETPVTIEPYQSGQLEKCCKRCDVFWENDSELERFVRFLRGKSIAVVGNAEFKEDVGSEIDSHDVVFRFNYYKIKGYESKVGSKTTVWVHHKKIKFRSAKEWGFLFEFCPDPNDSATKSELGAISGTMEEFKHVKINRPSTGISLLNWLHRNGFTFRCFGFDHFQTGHYFEKKRHKKHNPAREKIEFDRLCSAAEETNSYLDRYREYHQSPKNYPGHSLRHQVRHIAELVEDTDSKSLLDFGCGKGRQYRDKRLHQQWGIMPALYDPGVPEFSTLPDGPFDGVFCTDVFEHIPEQHLPDVIQKIFDRATKFVFIGICTRPAKAVLPNGENAHCTLHDMDWWEKLIRKHATRQVLTHLKTYGRDNQYRVLP